MADIYRQFTLPIVDISRDPDRQIVVDTQEGQFLGQVDTLLMPDGKTIFAGYPLGHGGPSCVLKRSDDGGLTWSDRLEVPENYLTWPDGAPTLHRLVGADGKDRIVNFVVHPFVMISISEDGGGTWSSFERILGDAVGHAPPKSAIPIDGVPGRYLAMYHTHDEDEDGLRDVFLVQIRTEDGGLTWSEPETIGNHPDYPGAHPCEPVLIRSPDGSQVLCIARENASKYGGLYMTSDNEGRTWTDLRQLPASLHGDRHAAAYSSDGRLLINFRDNRNPTSPTAGHFVGWVGRYEDIIEGREGQYRLLLQRHYGSRNDTGYNGLEVLPEGTFVATNYVSRQPWEVSSIISTRYSVKDIDDRVRYASSPANFANEFANEVASIKAAMPPESVIFQSGDTGVAEYRIPVLMTAPSGDLVACCDARVHNPGDAPNKINIVMRRSADGGSTWGDIVTLIDLGADTAANPCGLVDRQSGTIWLFFLRFPEDQGEYTVKPGLTGDTTQLWAISSGDNGISWSSPRDITSMAKRAEWASIAAGPGTGMQIRSGRLIVPMNHAVVGQKRNWRSYIIYSEDHGETWQIGGEAEEGTNECQVVELSDGRLMLNMRSYLGHGRRAVSISEDGGLTWGPLYEDPVLIEPVCQASMLTYSGGSDGKQVLLFSNPAVSPRTKATSRKRLVVRASFDDGKTWPYAKALYHDVAAYSCLCETADGSIGILYEKDREPFGDRHRNARIVFQSFSFKWLTGGSR